MQALCQLHILLWFEKMYGNMTEIVLPLPPCYCGRSSSTKQQRWEVLKFFEGTHNLAFDVKQNLATVSVGRRREEGRQTGALQLSGSTQSGMGHPASNCLFILCQRDLHISMSLRTAREVREQSRERLWGAGERTGKGKGLFWQKFQVAQSLCSSILLDLSTYRIFFSDRQPPWRVH